MHADMHMAFQFLSGFWTVLRGRGHSLPAGATEVKGSNVRYHLMNRLLKGLSWDIQYIPFTNHVKAGELTLWTKDGPVKGSNSSLGWVDHYLGDGCLTWWVKGGDAEPRIIVVRVDTADTTVSPFQLMGLKVLARAKTSKRLKEVVRPTQTVWTRPLNIKLVSSIKHYAVDGRGAMRMSTYLEGVRNGDMPERAKRRLINGVESGRITTAKFRAYYPGGMLKQEINIIPDDVWDKTKRGYDFACHAAEWKSEIKTIGGHFAHSWVEESTFGPLYLDIQTASWMGEWGFPLQVMRDTIASVFQKVVDDLTVRGEIPAHLVTEMTDDQGDVKALSSSDIQRLREVSRMWTAMGMKVQQSANIMFMAWMGQRQQVLSRDVWAPVPWGGRYHVCSDVFLQVICGYKPLHKDTVYFDERVGCVVYPAKLWKTHAEFFGGADFDGDVLAIMFRMTKDGKIVAVVYRNPNAPGEYRIVENVAMETFPIFFHGKEDANGVLLPDALQNCPMPVIDLESAPAYIDVRKGRMEMRPMPHTEATGDDHEWNRADALEQLRVELLNPGVGVVANMWMVLAWLGITPAWCYAMEDVVDACMQKPDELSFSAIKAWVKDIERLLHGKSIDAVLAGTHYVEGQLKPPKRRVSEKLLSKMGEPDDLGYFSTLRSYGILAVQEKTREMEVASMSVRQAWPLPTIGLSWNNQGNQVFQDLPEFNAISTERLAELNTMAKAMIDKTNADISYGGGAFSSFKQVSYAYPQSEDYNTPGNKERRSEANKQVIRACVRSLMRLDKDERNAVLVLAYRYCTDNRGTSGTKFHMGRGDRILYSALPEDEVSVFDLFVGALIRYGVADPVAEVRAAHAERVTEVMANQD